MKGNGDINADTGGKATVTEWFASSCDSVVQWDDVKKSRTYSSSSSLSSLGRAWSSSSSSASCFLLRVDIAMRLMSDVMEGGKERRVGVRRGWEVSSGRGGDRLNDTSGTQPPLRSEQGELAS